MNRKLPLLALLLVGTCVYAAEGQVYKWTDAGGVVYYSDNPPPKDAQNVQMVRVRGGSHAVGENNETTEKPAEKPADTTDSKPPPAATQNTAMADNANNRAKACAQARTNLELLQSGYAVSMTGANGQTQALDEKGRQGQIADTNAQIALYCK